MEADFEGMLNPGPSPSTGLLGPSPDPVASLNRSRSLQISSLPAEPLNRMFGSGRRSLFRQGVEGGENVETTSQNNSNHRAEPARSTSSLSLHRQSNDVQSMSPSPTQRVRYMALPGLLRNPAIAGAGP